MPESLNVRPVKGNEFAVMTKALNGIRLSMRSTSTHYINTFLWRKNEVFDGDYRTYANVAMKDFPQPERASIIIFFAAEDDLKSMK